MCMFDFKNYQKLCDVLDFFRPEMLDMVKNVLRVTPSLRRRSWEFASIFLALKQAGMLNGDKFGLGMGVGTERLIYGLAPFVRRALLTDLYQVDSGWVAVRTDNPNAMLRARAPWEVDWEKLDAKRMDMRKLDLPNEEVDFAWSTGAIEHIGSDDDFVRHFDEVARVLKPGGVYVFTTAIAFERETVRFPNNYLFNPYHLLNLIDRSRLQAAPVFDCSITPHTLNDPMFEDLSEFGLNMARQATPHLVSYRRGIITTANCMVLRKRSSASKTSVVGFEATMARAHRSARALVRNIWSKKQGIRLDDNKEHAESPVMYFGSGPIAITVDGEGSALRLASRSRGADKTMKPEAKTKIVNSRATLEFIADPDRIYKITVVNASGRNAHLSAHRLENLP